MIIFVCSDCSINSGPCTLECGEGSDHYQPTQCPYTDGNDVTWVRTEVEDKKD